MAPSRLKSRAVSMLRSRRDQLDRSIPRRCSLDDLHAKDENPIIFCILRYRCVQNVLPASSLCRTALGIRPLAGDCIYKHGNEVKRQASGDGFVRTRVEWQGPGFSGSVKPVDRVTDYVVYTFTLGVRISMQLVGRLLAPAKPRSALLGT
eukprot:635135-Amorphochlora_amoeboformis.AAC.1